MKLSIFEFIEKCNLDSSAVVFEIGAHMGFDTEIIKRLTNGARLYSFEPDPRNINALKERSIDKITTIVEAAISDVDSDSQPFLLSDGHTPDRTGIKYIDDRTWTASSSLREPKIHKLMAPWCKFDSEIRVKTMRLDTFCKSNNINHINFIWMDVQGCEDLVFLGAQEMLKKTEYLYTEYSNVEQYVGQKNLEELFKLLPGKWRVITEVDDINNILLENVEYRESLIKDSGAWTNKNLYEHVFDEPLAHGIVCLINNKHLRTCLDLGCGNGKYTEYFNNAKIETVGYDGNPHTPELTNGKCSVLDLSQPFDLNKTFDCVMCLEVGEHIPEKYQDTLVDNITKHSHNLIVLSWAIPGQGGYGHFNCKTNEDVKALFENKGFVNEPADESILRVMSSRTWFRDTIMIFSKKN